MFVVEPVEKTLRCHMIKVHHTQLPSASLHQCSLQPESDLVHHVAWLAGQPALSQCTESTSFSECITLQESQRLTSLPLAD
jgi:hypothetical protein